MSATYPGCSLPGYLDLPRCGQLQHSYLLRRTLGRPAQRRKKSAAAAASPPGECLWSASAQRRVGRRSLRKLSEQNALPPDWLRAVPLPRSPGRAGLKARRLEPATPRARWGWVVEPRGRGWAPAGTVPGPLLDC